MLYVVLLIVGLEDVTGWEDRIIKSAGVLGVLLVIWWRERTVSNRLLAEVKKIRRSLGNSAGHLDDLVKVESTKPTTGVVPVLPLSTLPSQAPHDKENKGDDSKPDSAKHPNTGASSPDRDPSD